MSLSVNYVWMNARVAEDAPVPTYFFCRVQENANRYPETSFRVWVDQPTACDAYSIPENVTVAKLSSIPAFSEIPLLRSVQEEDIWRKVDTARLVVLRNALQESAPAVKHTEIYSDFDVPDISLGSKDLAERLDKYGAAFGGVINPSNGLMQDSFANGYMAFRLSAIKLLDHVIEKISRTKLTGCNRSKIHFATCGALDSWARTSNGAFPVDWRQAVARLPVLFPPLWRGDINLRAELANLAPTDPKKVVKPIEAARNEGLK